MPKKSPVFTLDDDKKLIKWVARYPIIFVATEPKFRDVASRENVWIEVAKKVNKSVIECKKRWKNIRDAYLRHKKRTTIETSGINKFKWPLLPQLCFLDDSLDENTVTCTEQNNPANESVANSDIIIDDLIHDAEVLRHEAHSSTRIAAEETPTTSTSLPYAFVQSADPALRKRKQEFNETPRAKEKRSRNIVVDNSTVYGDPMDAFFKSMSLSVKKLPAELGIRAKIDICKIVSKYELTALSSSYNFNSESSFLANSSNTIVDINSENLMKIKDEIDNDTDSMSS